jgi:hypothetical protein
VLVKTGSSTTDFSIRGLIARNKLAAAGVAGVIAVLLAMTLVAAFAAKGGAVRDSTTCTQWGSANQNRQAAYARLYLREHGAPRGGQRSPASVITAINDGCARAYADDVSDTTTVVQAISGNF